MKELFETPHGKFLIDTERDKKFAKLFRERVYQHNGDLSIIAKYGFITAKSVVADIGAHVGTTVVPFAQIAHRVHAFEPTVESAQTLEENILLNDLHNVTVYRMGLGDHATTAKRSLPSNDNAATSMLVEGEGIQVDTLDAVLAGRQVDFIKIDVEGMEPQVLRGAEQTVATHRPAILFEVNLTGLKLQNNKLADITAFFKQHHYRLYLPKGGVLEPVLNLSLVAALLQPRMYFLGRHSGVFNVFAVPRERSLKTERSSLMPTFLLLLGLIKRVGNRI